MGMSSNLKYIDLLKLINLKRFFLAKVELLIFLAFSISSSTSISPFVSSTCRDNKNFSVLEENCWIWISVISRNISNILILYRLIRWMAYSIITANTTTNKIPDTSIRTYILIQLLMLLAIVASRLAAVEIIIYLAVALFTVKYDTAYGSAA